MNLARLEAQLTVEEGRRNDSYLDTRNLWTIGIGHHDDAVGPGMHWDDARIDQVFADDVAEKAQLCAAKLPWYIALSEPRQAVLIEMAFQMGVGRVPKPPFDKGSGLLEFQGMLGALRDERFHDAAEHIRSSLWAKQTAERARRMAAQLETGEWQS